MTLISSLKATCGYCLKLLRLKQVKVAPDAIARLGVTTALFHFLIVPAIFMYPSVTYYDVSGNDFIAYYGARNLADVYIGVVSCKYDLIDPTISFTSNIIRRVNYGYRFAWFLREYPWSASITIITLIVAGTLPLLRKKILTALSIGTLAAYWVFYAWITYLIIDAVNTVDVCLR